MLRGNKFQTPRSVWLNSAIAAAMCHSLLVWWGLSAWQHRQVRTTPPSPIKIVALPANATMTSPPLGVMGDRSAPFEALRSNSEGNTLDLPSPTATTNSSVSNQPLLTNTRQSIQPSVTPQESPAPQPQLPIAPAGSQVAPAPVTPATPPTVPQTPITPTSTPQPPVDSPSTPSSPQPPASPPPASPTPSTPVNPTPSEPAPSPSNPPTGGGNTAPPDAPNGEPSPGGIQSSWSLQEVPGGGSDIHDEIPQMPQGWQRETATLLENAGCASGIIAPGTSVNLTIRPTIDAQGQIMQLLPWEGNGGVPNAIVQCVEGLTSQMPPFIPARDGGSAIASDAVLLTIEIRGTP